MCSLNGRSRFHWYKAFVQLLDEDFHSLLSLLFLSGFLYLGGSDLILQRLVNDGYTQACTDKLRQVHIQFMMWEGCHMVDTFQLFGSRKHDSQFG